MLYVRRNWDCSLLLVLGWLVGGKGKGQRRQRFLTRVDMLIGRPPSHKRQSSSNGGWHAAGGRHAGFGNGALNQTENFGLAGSEI